MKRIAILNCLKANQVCAGVSCLDALRERRGGFAEYAGEDVDLRAFLRCSNCGKTPEEDPGMTEKLERLVSSGVETVHIGGCAQMKGIRCKTMETYASWLENHGIQVIWKTH